MVNFSNFSRGAQNCDTVASIEWSHFVELIAVEDPLKREYYLELAGKKLEYPRF